MDKYDLGGKSGKLLGALMESDILRVAIDFGNQNCVASILEGNGEEKVPLIFQFESGNRSIPTEVLFMEENNSNTFEIGDVANSYGTLNINSYFFDIKQLFDYYNCVPNEWIKSRYCGWTDERLEIKNGKFIGFKLPNGKVVTIAGLVAALIWNIFYSIDKDTSKKKEMIITSSPSWGDKQRRIIKDAAEIAGVKLLEIINSNVAQGLSYYFRTEDSTKLKNGVVVDAGDSTLEIAFLQMNYEKDQRSISVIREDTINIGGSLITDYLVDFVTDSISRYLKKEIINDGLHTINVTDGFDVKKLLDPKTRVSFRRHCEKMKRSMLLTPSSSMSIIGVYGGYDLDIKFPTEEFYKYQPVAQLINVIRNELNLLVETYSKLGKPSFVEVNGGNSRFPPIRDCLQEFVKAFTGETKRLESRMNVDEVFAEGAGWCLLDTELSEHKPRTHRQVRRTLRVPYTVFVKSGDELRSTFLRSDVIPSDVLDAEIFKRPAARPRVTRVPVTGEETVIELYQSQAEFDVISNSSTREGIILKLSGGSEEKTAKDPTQGLNTAKLQVVADDAMEPAQVIRLNTKPHYERGVGFIYVYQTISPMTGLLEVSNVRFLVPMSSAFVQLASWRDRGPRTISYAGGIGRKMLKSAKDLHERCVKTKLEVVHRDELINRNHRLAREILRGCRNGKKLPSNENPENLINEMESLIKRMTTEESYASACSTKELEGLNKRLESLNEGMKPLKKLNR